MKLLEFLAIRTYHSSDSIQDMVVRYEESLMVLATSVVGKRKLKHVEKNILQLSWPHGP